MPPKHVHHYSLYLKNIYSDLRITCMWNTAWADVYTVTWLYFLLKIFHMLLNRRRFIFVYLSLYECFITRKYVVENFSDVCLYRQQCTKISRVQNLNQTTVCCYTIAHAITMHDMELIIKLSLFHKGRKKVCTVSHNSRSMQAC